MKKLLQFFKWVSIDFYRYLKSGKEKKAPYGVHLYIGLPGKGKTISMVEKLERLRQEYPKIKIGTNFGYVHEDFAITSWRQLVEVDNGLDGVVFAIDEVQKTFESRSWKDFPVDVMDTLFFLRKKPKLFLCSAQSYDRVDKVFRELTNYVIRCNTLLGRWTFNRAFITEEYQTLKDSNGQRRVMTAWRYNFIQTDDLRSKYDTHKIVGKLSDQALSGELTTLSEHKQRTGSDNQTVTVVLDQKRKR